MATPEQQLSLPETEDRQGPPPVPDAPAEAAAPTGPAKLARLIISSLWGAVAALLAIQGSIYWELWSQHEGFSLLYTLIYIVLAPDLLIILCIAGASYAVRQQHKHALLLAFAAAQATALVAAFSAYPYMDASPLFLLFTPAIAILYRSKPYAISALLLALASLLALHLHYFMGWANLDVSLAATCIALMLALAWIGMAVRTIPLHEEADKFESRRP